MYAGFRDKSTVKEFSLIVDTPAIQNTKFNPVTSLGKALNIWSANQVTLSDSDKSMFGWFTPIEANKSEFDKGQKVNQQ